jgi:hypothetical protein
MMVVDVVMDEVADVDILAAGEAVEDAVANNESTSLERYWSP